MDPALPNPDNLAHSTNTSGSSSAKKRNLLLLVVVLIGLAVGLLFLGLSYFKPGALQTDTSPTGVPSKLELATFSSEQDFKDYLQKAQAASQTGFGGNVATTMMMEKSTRDLAAPAQGVAPQMASDQMYTPDRVSQTNVQVVGIDEPDIVKTDGKDIYYSSDSPIFYPVDFRLEGSPNSEAIPERAQGESSDASAPAAISVAPAKPAIAPDRVSILPIEDPVGRPIPSQPLLQTKVISATPAARLALKSRIDKQGEMLLKDKNLVIFSGNEINGFDITNSASPSAKWNIKLDERNQIVTSRLLNGKIYLISRTGIDFGRPCPYEPLIAGDAKISIPCVQIYHPVYPTNIDSTYTVSIINPSDGKVENNVSFVGSYNQTYVYMSENNLYISYMFNTDNTTFMYNFLTEKGAGLVPQLYLDKIQKLQTYDISPQAKQTELNVIMDQYRQTLSSDDMVKFEQEMQNRLKDYATAHLRDLSKTGIVRIGLGDFKVASTGVVPGHLLNQFSMDEYQDHLRVGTTVDGSMVGTQVSANDVLVLDKDLKTVGTASDLGKGERIYSVRFIGNKGYLVTFKQIDPFYVLDLSNPTSPQVKGELKIPGFSSYLDPLTENRILGVGQEEGKVKLSLFDVTDPANPTEIDKYNMDEFWTEVSNNHHAFLKDDKYKVFFLPGGQGGYIFGYEGDKFALKKAVAGYQVKRAVYINDYLYVLGDQRITVLNEKDWSTAGQLQF